MNAQSLSTILCEKVKDAKRHIVAIAGPPASGKTTLAIALRDQLRQRGTSCAVVSMDGFHLSNETLEAQGLLATKGSPATFHTDGFVQLIKKLVSATSSVSIPIFDREQDAVIQDAAVVDADCQFVLVEGNYLLLDEAPWSELHDCWNSTVFINPGMPVLKERLLDRWLQHGLGFTEALNRARSNDIPNADKVIESSKLDSSTLIIDSQ